MARILHAAVALLCLLPSGLSAPVDHCQTLVKPQEIRREELLGKWMSIAQSTDVTIPTQLDKLTKSDWFDLSAAPESDAIDTLESGRVFGKCLTLKYQMIVKNNTLSMEQPFSLSAVRLSSSCPDCMVIFSNESIGATEFKSLLLSSRRATIPPEETEEFLKQAKCLNLPTPVIYTREHGVCQNGTLIDFQGTDLWSLVLSLMKIYLT